MANQNAICDAEADCILKQTDLCFGIYFGIDLFSCKCFLCQMIKVTSVFHKQHEVDNMGMKCFPKW